MDETVRAEATPVRCVSLEFEGFRLAAQVAGSMPTNPVLTEEPGSDVDAVLWHARVSPKGMYTDTHGALERLRFHAWGDWPKTAVGAGTVLETGGVERQFVADDDAAFYAKSAATVLRNPDPQLVSESGAHVTFVASSADVTLVAWESALATVNGESTAPAPLRTLHLARVGATGVEPLGKVACGRSYEPLSASALRIENGFWVVAWSEAGLGGCTGDPSGAARTLLMDVRDGAAPTLISKRAPLTPVGLVARPGGAWLVGRSDEGYEVTTLDGGGNPVTTTVVDVAWSETIPHPIRAARAGDGLALWLTESSFGYMDPLPHLFLIREGQAMQLERSLALPTAQFPSSLLSSPNADRLIFATTNWYAEPPAILLYRYACR